MKMKLWSTIVGSLLVSIAVSYADTLFQETFENPGLADANIATIGWHANSGSTGTVLSEANTLLANGPVVSSVDFIVYGLTVPTNLLTWKETTDIGSIRGVTNISVEVRNEETNADLKVAIKVDNDWYVTQNVMNSVVSAIWKTNSINVQTVSWNTLTFVSGSTLAEGGAVSLPSSGTVNAIGIYDAVSSRVRFDTFIVSGPRKTLSLGVLTSAD
jgi:hypothetical protein